jgi:NAD(P)-dependent dehydrogenase (short-subunit alcohol dehydrogenase family)
MDVLISGASTGIGKACAVHMARLGHNVWAGVRSQKNFDDLEKLNVKGLTPIFLDVTSDESVDACLSRIKKSAGILNALVNNAGIAVGGPVEAVRLEDWRRQFDTNFFGAVRLTQACLPLLRECKGRIVNVSSISGRVASPFLGPYAASKFALEAFSDSLRRELHMHGVQVSIVEPGPIATPIWEKSKTEGLEKSAKYSPAMQELYGRRMQKFMKRTEEISDKAAPVSVVVNAVAHALLAKSPRLRYPVGRGIKLFSTALRLTPDKWLDQLMR